MDPSRIEPGQRYAMLDGDGVRYMVKMNMLDEPRPGVSMGVVYRHPIVEPERLHEIPVGATVLNVATGRQAIVDAAVRWWLAGLPGDDLDMPLLALVATPEEDA